VSKNVKVEEEEEKGKVSLARGLNQKSSLSRLKKTKKMPKMLKKSKSKKSK